MDASRRRRTPYFGRVSVRRLRSVPLDSSRTAGSSRSAGRSPRATVSRYTWRPSRLIRGNVVAEVPLALNCVSIARRGREFRPPPELGPHGWIVLASVGGHAMLRHLHPATGEQHFSYHAMRLVYQLAPRLREHLIRGFRRLNDLYIPRPARVGGEINVLPDDIGLDARGRGHHWTVPQLADAGRATATDLGMENPSDEQVIRLGIWAAAQKRPIDVRQLPIDEATALVRIGLFDFGPADEKLDPAIADEAVGRLIDALEKHEDDTTNQFHRWFFDEFDNIVHQISKRKRPGGAIARAVVRQAILEWVFKSFRYVGDCVDLQAKAFADACRPKLIRPERAAFAAYYERQPYLGDMPLILLHEQLPIAREAVSDMINNPGNPQKAGVLLRVLQFHADMVRKKRESERQDKRLRAHRNRQNKAAATVSLDKAAEIRAASGTDLFQEIAAELRERRGTKCACRTTAEWVAELDEAKPKGNQVIIIDCCTDCGHKEVYRTTVEELKQLATLL